MAGLVQAIHLFLGASKKDVDARQTSLRSLRKPDCYGRA
jgi:hypothetical protein